MAPVKAGNVQTLGAGVGEPVRTNLRNIKSQGGYNLFAVSRVSLPARAVWWNHGAQIAEGEKYSLVEDKEGRSRPLPTIPHLPDSQ